MAGPPRVGGGSIDYGADDEFYYEPEPIEVTIGGITMAPSVLNTETSGSAKVISYTDQCGHSESDQLSSGNTQHKIEALLYKNVLQDVYELYSAGESVDITLPAEIDTVEVFITDVTVKQTQEHKKFVARDNISRDVFEVQIQLKTKGAIEETN